MNFDPDFVICPLCFDAEFAPCVVGNQCLCGGHYIAGKAVAEWKRVYDLVGSVVAEARLFRAAGAHHIAVYCSIGKCLIDRDEFEWHFARLLEDRDGDSNP